jgi:type IV pilus assembly protein PilC
MKFNYQARTKTGKIQSGVIEASSREAAINLLRSYNLYVTVLEVVTPPFYARRIKFFERISKREIVAFSRQLATMFKSEVPLVEALQTLAKQTTNLGLKEKILNISEKVEGGSSLSKTFSNYPEIFSPFYINMVKSGEVSGKLSEIFSYLADYLEREYYFLGKIRGAMIYPIFIFVVFILIFTVIIYLVIPPLSQLFTESGGKIPTITKIVIGTSNFLRSKGWILILLLLFIIFFLYYYFKTKEGKKFFDKMILKIPILKTFLRKLYLTRLATNLSTLISGGLPITQALEITGEVVGNEVFKSIILETTDRVKKGEQMSAIFENHPKNIPPFFVQMTVVGEKTGSLDSVFLNIVDFYQKDIERALDNFIRLLEPVMIVILALMVAGLTASILLPLYQRFTFY